MNEKTLTEIIRERKSIVSKLNRELEVDGAIFRLDITHNGEYRFCFEIVPSNNFWLIKNDCFVALKDDFYKYLEEVFNNKGIIISCTGIKRNKFNQINTKEFNEKFEQGELTTQHHVEDKQPHNFVKSYIQICKNFAEDTYEWNSLPSPGFFTTGGSGENGWSKTCDNDHGGIDVSWAFHCTEEEIEKQAVGKLLDYFMNDIENDTDWFESKEDVWYIKQTIETYENI